MDQNLEFDIDCPEDFKDTNFRVSISFLLDFCGIISYILNSIVAPERLILSGFNPFYSF